MRLPKDPMNLTPGHLERAIKRLDRLRKKYDDMNDPETEAGDHLFQEICEQEDLVKYLADVVN
jgi:hypothetical protein